MSVLLRLCRLDLSAPASYQPRSCLLLYHSLLVAGGPLAPLPSRVYVDFLLITDRRRLTQYLAFGFASGAQAVFSVTRDDGVMGQ